MATANRFINNSSRVTFESNKKRKVLLTEKVTYKLVC